MRTQPLVLLAALLLATGAARAQEGAPHDMHATPAPPPAPAPAAAHMPAHAPAHTPAHAQEHAQPERVIEIAMDDAMRFHPDRIPVRPGETVRLRLHNAGRLSHEFVLGKLDEILAHAQEMRAHPGMPAHHEANALTLEPGRSGELVWTFAQPGTLDFACTIPGHYEAGMRGRFLIE